jgi:hypothetical protein
MYLRQIYRLLSLFVLFVFQFLIYKFINTFIDGKTQTSQLARLCLPLLSSPVLHCLFMPPGVSDLFAFIIKMPTMHRLSVFRDDLVFFIYLYQRHIYRVDKNRPVEK